MADSRDVTRSRRLACIFLRVSFSALVGGCGLGHARLGPSRRIARPEAVLAAYADALARGDSQAAYELLSPGDRQALDLSSYRKLMALDAAEARELAVAMEQAGPARVTAHVQLAGGGELTLELAGDSFAVVDPLSRYYGQASPRAALRSFVRAVEHARWDVILALMPAVDSAGVDPTVLRGQLEARREELTRMSALLAASLDSPIEVVGDRATMPYGESYTARLIREDAGWKLEDPQ
ncbi:MAG: hypothetical protein JWN04_3515 [Myxococcaceae bacterium]|nr:hypothetical protein [Myxococcaceae bacterium]